jgi:hypothetical protein
LDKKLIVDVENIEYKSKKSKVKNSLDDIRNDLGLLPDILKFFQIIHVDRLKIDDNEFTISLNDKLVYLDSKFINLASKIDFSSNQVILNLYSLYLKDLDVMFNGKVKIDYFKERLSHVGEFYHKDIVGDIRFGADTKKANFFVNSEKFKSLKFLKSYFRLSPEAESWMYDNVIGDLQLKEFYGSIDLINYKLLEESLSGMAVIESPKIKFQKDIEPVNAKRVNVLFKKGNLYFDLIEPTFKDKSLHGSKVYINNLVSENHGEVNVVIKSKTKLDEDILEILESYDISLPLIQKTGITHGQVHLIIPYLLSEKMTTKGLFIIEDADLLLKNFEFHTQKAEVELFDTLVNIRDSSISHKDMIDAKLNLEINTKALSAKGDSMINSFLIESKEKEIVHIKDLNTNLEVDFSENVLINLLDLNTKINIEENIRVDVEELHKIHPYSELLQELSVKDGTLHLDIENESKISFKTDVKGLNFPIYKDDILVDSLSVNGHINGDDINLVTTDNKIKYRIFNNEHFLDIEDYMVFINTKNDTKKDIPILNVKVKNIDLKVDEDIYHIASGETKIEPKKLSFLANVERLDIPLSKKGKDITSLEISGIIDDQGIALRNNDDSLKLNIQKDNYNIFISGFDIKYEIGENNKDDKDDKDSKKIDLNALNSNIIINDEFIIPAHKYELRLRNKSKYFNLKHNKTEITYKEQEDGKIDLYGHDIVGSFINTIFKKEILSGGNILLTAKGKDDKINGKLLLTDVKVKDLAIINNLLLFINSSPALINPLLVVPRLVGAVSNDGFNLSGYHINEGTVQFNLDMESNILDITKLITIGNGIDFDGKGKVNLNDKSIDSKLKLIFLKDYSSIVGVIPVVNYVVLGKNKRVETEANIFGPLSNPKIKTKLTKEAFSIPVNIVKRIFSSPIEFINYLKDLDNDTDKKNDKKEVLGDNILNE